MAYIQKVVNELNELEAHRLNIKKELSEKYPEYCLWNNTNLFDDYIKALKAGVFNSDEWKMILILNSNINKLKEIAISYSKHYMSCCLSMLLLGYIISNDYYYFL